MNAALTLFTRFAGFIDSLKKTIAAGSVPVQGRPARLAAPLGPLLFNRLGRLTTRLRELLARIEAERTKPRPIARPRTRAPQPRRPATKPGLPRGFGWITQPLPETNGHAHTLRAFLCEPETEALIASDPRIGRILRPLCDILGIDLRMIYRMVPQPQGADLTRRHPLRRDEPDTTRDPPNPRPRTPRPQRPPSPPPQPLRAPTLDDVQSLLDRVFSPHHHAPGPSFARPDFFYVHPK